MDVTKDTINMIREARNTNADLKKAYTVSSGLIAIDLEPVAKTLFPVITPFRNFIPRVQGKGGTGVQWRAVTAINPSKISNTVEEGKRGGIIDQTTKSYLAPYSTLGLENSTTFEAQSSAEGFDNIKALASLNLLQSMMVGEENSIIGSNRTVAMAAPTFTTVPTDASAQADGNITAGTTVHVVCVPLTHEGYRASNASIVGTAPILANRTKTNADGTTTVHGGYSGAMVTANVVSAADANDKHVVTAIVSEVQGAMGYAWFWGATKAGATLGAITTINSLRATTNTGAGTQVAATTFDTDHSTNAYGMDGIISIIAGGGQEAPAAIASGALISKQADGVAGVGTPLTSDGGVGIVEINNDLKTFWTTSRLSPQEIWCNAQELQNIGTKVIAGGGAPLFRFISDSVRSEVSQGTLTAGAVVGFYLNKFAMGGGVQIPIRLHPDVAPGTILYISKSLPSTYPVANVPGLIEVETRKEYYSLEWPLTTRTWYHGVYAEEVLKCYFPPAFGMRYNIANG